MKKHNLLYLFCCFLLATITFQTIAQPTSCPSEINDAMAIVANTCSDLARNQACYGNDQITATLRTEDVMFASSGDITDVNTIQSLQLTSPDLEQNTWGIALMSLQASLPDTTPGQNVTFLMFGDVTVENNVSGLTLDVTTTANARIRREPVANGDLNVIAAAPAGSVLPATGRNEAGDWLRVSFEDPNDGWITGWTSTLVLSGAVDRMNLPVVGHYDPILRPMQSFILKTGIGDAGCAEAPDSGLLVQTPQGATGVNFTANGVDITLGSTAFIQTSDPTTLQIALLEGTGFITADGVTQIVPAGTFTTVPLDDAGEVPVGAPTPPQPYNESSVTNLPVSDTPLPEAIDITPPLDEAQVEEAIESAQSGITPVAGNYRITTLQILTYEDTLQTQQGVAGCYLNNQVGQTFTVNYDFADYTGGGTYIDEFSNEDSTYKNTFTFNTPTSFTLTSDFTNTWVGGGTGETYTITCQIIREGIYVGG